MKQRFIQPVLLAALLGICGTSVAADGWGKGDRRLKHRFTEFANVVNVQPVFREISYQKPQRECWIENEQYVTDQGYIDNNGYNRQTRRSNAGDTLVGGVIGGAIGNQLGRRGSRGARNAATVAGVIIGSVIANESRGNTARHRRHQPTRQQHRQPVYGTRQVEKCKNTVHTSYEKKINGYDVTYEYRGRTFTTRMNRDPGRQIELQVNVSPARQ